MNEPSVTYRQYDPVTKTEGEPVGPPVSLFRSRKGHEKPGPDDFVELNSRRQRRAYKAQRARTVSRHQRAYVRRELRKEREANNLAQFFNLHDGLVIGDARARDRAHRAILARVRYVRAQDQKRYDKEWKARQKNRDLPAPHPVISHEEVLKQLRAVAKTARTVVPKAKRLADYEPPGGWRRDLMSVMPTTASRTGRTG